MSVVLLDGANGHELKRILNASQTSCSDAAIMQAAQALHSEYIAAGADVITTNTFLCTPLHCSNDIKSVRANVIAGVRVAVAAAAAARDEGRGRAVRVAGCVPPLGECYITPVNDEEESVRQYEIILSAMLMSDDDPNDENDEGNADGRWSERTDAAGMSGVSIVLAETLSTSAEGIAVLRALDSVLSRRQQSVDVDVWVSFSLDDGDDRDGKGCSEQRLRGGESLSDAISALMRAAKTLRRCKPPSAVLVNCSEMEVCLDAVRALKAGSGCTALVGIYPNAFMTPTGTWLRAGGVRDTPTGLSTALMPSEEFARSLARAVDLGADVVGGCCGTTPAYMRAAYESVRAREKESADGDVQSQL